MTLSIGYCRRHRRLSLCAQPDRSSGKRRGPIRVYVAEPHSDRVNLCPSLQQEGGRRTGLGLHGEPKQHYCASPNMGVHRDGHGGDLVVLQAADGHALRQGNGVCHQPDRGEDVRHFQGCGHHAERDCRHDDRECHCRRDDRRRDSYADCLDDEPADGCGGNGHGGCCADPDRVERGWCFVPVRVLLWGCGVPAGGWNWSLWWLWRYFISLSEWWLIVYHS